MISTFNEFSFIFSAFNHRNLYDLYMNSDLNEQKVAFHDPKFIEVNSELHDYLAKSSPTRRPMSPELQSCVKAVVKHGVDLFNALVFCIAEREFNGKMPQDKAEPSKPEPSKQPPGKRDNRGRRHHRDSRHRRNRSTPKPLRLPLKEVDDQEHEEVNSIYDRVLLTIGLW